MAITKDLESIDRPLKGRVYQNRVNNKLYYLIGIVNDYNTKEEVVLFTEITTGKQYVRPLSEWMGRDERGQMLNIPVTKIENDN